MSDRHYLTPVLEPATRRRSLPRHSSEPAAVEALAVYEVVEGLIRAVWFFYPENPLT